jgi:hypothetical protein
LGAGSSAICQIAVSIAKMKWSTLATAAVLPLASASGFTHEQYASGEVMDLMMHAKEVCFIIEHIHIPY